MSRSVTVITAREVYRYKMTYHGDKFLHIRAVTIANNTDHTLHYAIEGLCSRFLRTRLLLFQVTYSYTKRKTVPYLYGVYVSSVADLDRPKKKRVMPWSKRN